MVRMLSHQYMRIVLYCFRRPSIVFVRFIIISERFAIEGQTSVSPQTYIPKFECITQTKFSTYALFLQYHCTALKPYPSGI